MTHKVKIGQKIEIIFNERVYKTKIENIADDMNYIIGTPIVHNTYVYIPLNEIIKIRYLAKDCIYQFEAKVMHIEANKVHLITVTQAGPMERIQRRENFRLETAISAAFIKQYDNEPHKCIIKDISGGGVKLTTQQKLDVSDRINLTFSLDGMGTFNIEGVVVRINNDGSNYDVGISFRNLGASERERIVGYIFQEQRKMIKKGLV